MKGEATVVKNAGSHYLLSCLPEWDLFPAVLRGRIRLKGSSATNPVAVGDRVSWEWDAPGGAASEASAASGAGASGAGASGAGASKGCQKAGAGAGGSAADAECCGRATAAIGATGMTGAAGFAEGARPTPEHPATITQVHERRNYVIRRSTNLSRQAHIIAANVDEAFIIVTLYFPEIKLPFLDRILVTCEVYNVPVTIILNKVDLYREFAAEQIEDFRRIYEGAGYRVIETSALTGEGVDTLRAAMGSRVCLLSGESGVGKSSLIKALDPALDPKVGRISAAHLQGKHTTSLYEMYRTVDGACIIDSPGLRGFGLVDLKKEEIALYFPEMLEASRSCRFTPCTHTHEPGCAVKAAVDEGRISAERYNSYLGMLEEDNKFR